MMPLPYEDLLKERDALKVVLGDLLKERGAENLYKEMQEMELERKVLERENRRLVEFRRRFYVLFDLVEQRVPADEHPSFMRDVPMFSYGVIKRPLGE